MPSFKHSVFGARVTVSDEKAATLGSEWERIEDEPEKKPAPKRASVKK